MRFSSHTAVLTAMVATALASPISKNPNSPKEIIKRNSVNDCQDSSFFNDTSDASPLVADCLILASNISPGGTWPLGSDFGSPDNHFPAFGTCIFGGSTDKYDVNVGNQDIIDLIHSSIDMFQSPDGKVGAHGSVDCQDHWSAGTDTLHWGIYHT